MLYGECFQHQRIVKLAQNVIQASLASSIPRILQFRERKMERKCQSLATNLPTVEAALTAYPTANRTPQSTMEYAKREKSKNEKSYLLALTDTKIKKARKTPGEDILIFAEFQSKENLGVAAERKDHKAGSRYCAGNKGCTLYR